MVEFGTFAQVTEYALQAVKACRPLPVELLDTAIEEGNQMITPGMDVDDALEIEYALKSIKALKSFREAIEEIPET